jgi:RNA recognition motif-containing protein
VAADFHEAVLLWRPVRERHENKSQTAHPSTTPDRRNMTDAKRWNATVYVGGLAGLVNPTNLHDAFIPFGEIADITLPKNDRPDATEPHRGFAYVEFEDAEDAKEAIDNMDQSDFFGRVLKVSAAKAPKSADEGLGSKTAVWQQVRPLTVTLISRNHALTQPTGELAG